MKKKLGIFIPTFERLARNLDIFLFYDSNGYLNHDEIDIVVIENPSISSICPSRLPSRVQYFPNSSQIGLHGSWHRAVTALAHNYEWVYIIGDTDYPTLSALSLCHVLIIVVL